MTQPCSPPEALRLVKLRLPAALVRRMDDHVASSFGAYVDRNEFVTEAIWDRLNEDAQHSASDLSDSIPTTDSLGLQTGTPAPVAGEEPEDLPVPPPLLTAIEPLAAEPQAAETAEGHGEPSSTLRATLQEAVADRGSTPVLPRQEVRGTIFGLHNRDLPSLWVTAQLALQVRRDKRPVGWSAVVHWLREPAQECGSDLRRLDGAAVKPSTGFPKPGPKGRASEDRLITTALGAPARSGATGPAFLLGLVAADDPTVPRPALAPTPEGLDLLADLLDQGLTAALPQPEAATRRWLQHIAAVAPDEHTAWMSVLAALHDKPSRSELVAQFPQWPGSRADTNCTGYVSRGREWGLVTPDLFDGRYRLTALGEHLLHEGTIK